MNASRDKGCKFERELVNAALDAGLTAERTAPMQGKGRDEYADVLIAGLRCECKSLKAVPNWCELLSALVHKRPAKLGDVLRRYVKGHDALCLRQTGWAELILVILPDDRVVLLDEWLASLVRKGATEDGQ